MTLTGRLTADAVVNTLKDDRKVVNFSLAINDSYKPKNGERVKLTTFCNCAYWISEKIAPYLKKASLVELFGRMYATPYVGKDGTAKVSLNCQVSHIKILTGAKGMEATSKSPATFSNIDVAEDDIPF